MNLENMEWLLGEIFNDNVENNNVIDNTNRLKSGLVKYDFVLMDETQFEIITYDISIFNSTADVIKNLKLKNNIYRIILTGTRNLDVEKLVQDIKLSNENVYEVIDQTKAEYNLEQISKERTIKGVFTKNMLEELKRHPEKEEMIMKAIEYVYNS